MMFRMQLCEDGLVVVMVTLDKHDAAHETFQIKAKEGRLECSGAAHL